MTARVSGFQRMTGSPWATPAGLAGLQDGKAVCEAPGSERRVRAALGRVVGVGVAATGQDDELAA